MKLLFITEFFPTNDKLQFTGGVESFSYYLVKQLLKKNQVTVICRDLGKQVKLKDKNLKIIKVGPLTSKIDTSFSTIPSRVIFLISAVRKGIREDFDLVQGHNFITHPVAYLIGLIKNKPTIAWYPDVFVGDWFKLTAPISALVGEISERINLKFPWSQIIALSNSTSHKLQKQGINSEKITTIYAGVDKFPEVQVKKQSKFTIITIARLVPYKRVDLLIKAVSLLKKDGLDINLIIVGQGSQKSNLEKLVQDSDLKNQVTFKSNLSREELAVQIKSSHLFCLLSEVEGFGLVTIEAASLGLPFVVTDMPVLREVTRDMGGLYFKKGKASDLALKIRKLIQDKTLYKKLSKEALNLASFYSWGKIANDFENVYDRILTSKKKILVLVDAWFPLVGGGQIHVWEICKRLADKELKITIFTRNLGEWTQDYPNIKVIRVGHSKQFSNLAGRFEYLSLALIHALFNRYDLIHMHAFSPGLLAPVIKLFKKTPIVFTAHGNGFKIAGFPFLAKTLEDLVFYKIKYDWLITVAKNTLDKKTNTPVVSVIPNGVNIDQFSKAQRKRDQVKQIIFVGRLVKDKGADILIDAFRKLDNSYSLIIVGEGEELNSLKRQSKGLNIKFTGRLEGDELIAKMKEADLMIMPSRVEGMPLRLLEAWAAKLPVLATNVGDNPLFIKDNVNGFLSEIDSQDIAKKIISIKNANLSKITAEVWLKVQSYTWEKIANKTFLVYKELLNEKS